MRKILYISIILLSFSSCLTVGRIERNCDKFGKICITDKVIEYRDTTIYINDTILYPLPKDTVFIKGDVQIIENKAQMKPIYKEFGLIGMDVWVLNSKLGGKAYFLDPSLEIPIRDTITIEKIKIKESNTIQLPPEKYIPKFYKFTFWFSIFIFAIIGVFIFLKFRSISGWFKGLKK